MKLADLRARHRALPQPAIEPQSTVDEEYIRSLSPVSYPNHPPDTFVCPLLDWASQAKPAIPSIDFQAPAMVVSGLHAAMFCMGWDHRANMIIEMDRDMFNGQYVWNAHIRVEDGDGRFSIDHRNSVYMEYIGGFVVIKVAPALGPMFPLPGRLVIHETELSRVEFNPSGVVRHVGFDMADGSDSTAIFMHRRKW